MEFRRLNDRECRYVPNTHCIILVKLRHYELCYRRHSRVAVTAVMTGVPNEFSVVVPATAIYTTVSTAVLLLLFLL